MKKTLLSALLVGGMVVAQASYATVFDFDYYINNTDDQPAHGIGEYGASSLTFVEDGITLTATGLSPAGNQYNAYLDADYNSGPGGLGVCKQLGDIASTPNVTETNQCVPSNDDNVTDTEILRLTFGSSTLVSSVSFLNGEHETDFQSWLFPEGPSTNTQVNVKVDGGSVYTYDLAALVVMNLTGTTFDFYLADPTGDYAYAPANQFYITKIAVPAPGALGLLAIGLLGVYGANRVKKPVEVA